MCYAKPGPRCSKHAREALQRAEAAVEVAPNAHAFIRAREDAAAAQDAYNRTPEGIKALRDRGDLERAAHYEREREERIKTYNASKALFEDGAEDALEDRYNNADAWNRASGDEKLEFLEFEVTRNADGSAKVTTVFVDPWNHDEHYESMSSWMTISDFSDPETYESELEEYHERLAKTATGVHAISDRQVAASEEAVEEYTGVDGASDLVQMDYRVEIAHRPEDVRRDVNRYLSSRIERSDVDDLKRIIAHPCAEVDTRFAAWEALNELED